MRVCPGLSPYVMSLVAVAVAGWLLLCAAMVRRVV
jgi:hypothetical protein